MIKHEPLFDTDKICEHYTKKDGVPVTYVCTSALKGEAQAMDIFYRDTPHPEFGNRYFGLYNNPFTGNLMITNADRIEQAEFGLVEDDDGNLQYSAHRHDYKQFENGNMIDGGRAYIKSSMCEVKHYVVRNGEMTEKKNKAGETEIRKTDYNSFDDWMDEIENYATRRERALEDTDVILWAKAAWDIQQEKIEKYETILKHAMAENTLVRRG